MKKEATPKADKCVFVSPPAECIFHVGGLCAPSGLSHVVLCIINHRRLLLSEEGRTVALQAFITVLDHPHRQKPISGQAGRALVDGEGITG